MPPDPAPKPGSSNNSLDNLQYPWHLLFIIVLSGKGFKHLPFLPEIGIQARQRLHPRSCEKIHGFRQTAAHFKDANLIEVEQPITVPSRQ